MQTCFVIQPFDNERYDRRFDETYGPAIKAAKLEPYRVDRDPAVSIPISQIEDGIRRAAVCFVEISEDNPNVWFEFGFAISEAKETVIICDSQKRFQFPFDIQHRRIIRYKTNSVSDFQNLGKQITEALIAASERAENFQAIEATPIRPKEGLTDYEISILATIASNGEADSGPSHWRLIQSMDKIGYTAIATQIGCKKLIRKALIEPSADYDNNGNEFAIYKVTSAGWDWLLANENQLVLKNSSKNSKATSDDDEIPF